MHMKQRIGALLTAGLVALPLAVPARAGGVHRPAREPLGL